MVTRERLLELLEYDPETALLTWKQDRGGKAKTGIVAGRLAANGYIDITIDSRRYKAHRLAWLYVHGEWPPEEIDHRDLDKANNRLANLRPASHQQNLYNRPKQKCA